MSLLNNNKLLKSKAFKQSFDVLRPSTGSYGPDGRWTDSGDTLIPASGSVQPAKGRDLQYLQDNIEGGVRISQAIRIYSAFEFKPGVVGANARKGDKVSYNGIVWHVVTLSDFSPHGHQKVFGVRFDAQDA